MAWLQRDRSRRAGGAVVVRLTGVRCAAHPGAGFPSTGGRCGAGPVRRLVAHGAAVRTCSVCPAAARTAVRHRRILLAVSAVVAKRRRGGCKPRIGPLESPEVAPSV